MSRTSRAALAVLTNYAATLLVAVAGFVLVPIVLRFVSRDDYGLWLTLGQAFAYLNLLDFGVGSALIRRTAELRARADGGAAVEQALSTALVAFAGLGGLALLAGLAFGLALPAVVELSAGQATLATRILVVVSIYTALAFPLRAGLKTLQGLQQMATANVLTMLEGAATPLLAIALLWVGTGLLALPLASAATGTLAGLVAFAVLRYRTPSIRVRPGAWSREEARVLFGWSALLWLNSLAVIVIYQTDNLVIASGQGLGAATIYALTTRLPLYALPLIVVLADSCIPGAVELVAQGRVDRLRDVYVNVLRVTGAAAVGAALVATVINARFVALWVGPDTYGGDRLTLIAAGILVYRVLMQTGSIVVLGVGRIRGVVVASLVEAALNLALSLWWVRQFGVAGVAAGTLAAGLLTSGWFVTRLTSREMDVPARRLLWRGVGLPLVCAVPAAVVGVSLGAWLPPGSWLALAILACAVSVSYGAAVLMLGASADERRAIVGQWLSRMPSRRPGGPSAPLPARSAAPPDLDGALPPNI